MEPIVSPHLTKTPPTSTETTPLQPNHFTRLIESEKKILTTNEDSSDFNELDEDEERDEEEELNFNNSLSNSPQPQPDLLQVEPDGEFSDGWGLLEFNHTNTESSNMEPEVKTTKKKSKSSKKTEHNISVELNQGTIQKLKSLYVPNPTTPEPKLNNITSEARVFAKVCVANLRRSFGDLTNLSEDNPINKPRPSSSGSERIILIDQETTWKTKSLVDLQSSCSGVSVLKLKSSFSKFDQLAKKNVQKCVENKEKESKICKSCTKEVFLVELIKAEKASWHRNCFRCSECSKQLSVDTYSSNEGKLYCKPHFRTLFQPKPSFNEEPEVPSKPEVIIRESNPTELPPDVARASDHPTTGLEDINIDVRSKFEMFENFKEPEVVKIKEDVSQVKRSASVLARLARYEGKEDSLGVLNDDLHLENMEDLVDEESEEEDLDVVRSEMRRKVKNPVAAMAEILQCKQMEEIRGKWEEGMNSNKEELSESRKAEMAKFRTRLCQGKSNHLKELYEKSLTSNEEESEERRGPAIDLELLEKAKKLREMFEKGEVINNEDEEDGPKSLVERDMAVFESGVARQSRSLFLEMDQNLAQKPNQVFAPRTPTDLNRFNKQTTPLQQAPPEVIKSSDPTQQIQVKTEDLSNKFKFFETYEQTLSEQKNREKTAFRITPPRDTQNNQSEEPQQEVYRDPTIVQCDITTPTADLIKSRTTSKMLNVFRQMEQEKEGPASGPRPLKQFTPPREPMRVESESEPDESEEIDEEDEEEEEEQEVTEKDAFLKEVGSLARARSLRARFERWEQEEKAKPVREIPSDEQEEESIESARNLKEKFEKIQLLQSEKVNNKECVKVRRFVVRK